MTTDRFGFQIPERCQELTVRGTRCSRIARYILGRDASLAYCAQHADEVARQTGMFAVEIPGRER